MGPAAAGEEIIVIPAFAGTTDLQGYGGLCELFTRTLILDQRI